MASKLLARLGRGDLAAGEGSRSQGLAFDSPAARLALALAAAGSSLGLSLALQAPASAVILADNLGENTRSGLLVGFSLGALNYEGMKFNTTSASVVNEVVVKLQQSSDSTAATQGRVFFDIYSDNAGLPGSVVATIGGVVASSLPANPINFLFPPQSIPLLPNSSYYLVARPDGFSTTATNYILWNYTQNPDGFVGYTQPVRVRSALKPGDVGLNWETYPGTNQCNPTNGCSNLQLRINASEVPGPLPVLGAAAAFGWSRRLRRRIGSTPAAKRSSGSLIA